MQILGYIIGGLLIAVCIGVTAYNVYKFVKLIKEKKKIKNETQRKEVQD